MKTAPFDFSIYWESIVNIVLHFLLFVYVILCVLFFGILVIERAFGEIDSITLAFGLIASLLPLALLVYLITRWTNRMNRHWLSRHS